MKSPALLSAIQSQKRSDAQRRPQSRPQQEKPTKGDAIPKSVPIREFFTWQRNLLLNQLGRYPFTKPTSFIE